MSAPIKTKEDLTRLAWLVELRRQGHRQCLGMLSDNADGVCALGLLAEVAGLSKKEAYTLGHDNIGSLAGLSSADVEELIFLHDDQEYSFPMLATVIEGWFP